MTLLDFSQQIFGNKGNSYSPAQIAATETNGADVLYGTAQAGAGGGVVEVLIDGTEIPTDPEDPDYGLASTMVCDTDELIHAGDRVTVVRNGQNAKAIALTPDSTGYTELREAIDSLGPSSTAHLWVQETGTASVPAGAYVTVNEHDEADPAAALNGGFVQITTTSVGIGSNGIVTSTFDEDSVELASGLAKLEASTFSGGYMLHGQSGGAITSTKDVLIGGDNGIVFMDERPIVFDDANNVWIVDPNSSDTEITYMLVRAGDIQLYGSKIRFTGDMTFNGVADKDWQYLSGTPTGNRARWMCKSGIVVVEVAFGNSAGMSAGATKTFGTIPEGYRPSGNFVETAAYMGSNNVATLWVNGTGTVQGLSHAATSKIYGSVVYPV